MIALACAGHVLIDLPLFGAPVFLLGGGVWWTTRSERKRAEGGGERDAANAANGGVLSPNFGSACTPYVQIEPNFACDRLVEALSRRPQ